ncbi:MAG TPA: response regulator transcription factor [Candidatus Tenderia sp.]|nr:response regulator transcription factor [Candidatus Tenderia sp.]
MNYSVLIADDHPIYRVGLRHILSSEACYQCTEARDGEAAIRQITEGLPDIAVLDIKMPFAGGLEVLEKTKSLSPKTRFVMLTMYDDSKLIEKAFDLGAHAYLLKEDAESELIRCLEAVCNGQRYLSASIAQRDAAITLGDEKIASLTPAELEIAKLVGEFKTSREIAEQQNISIRTVQNHRHHIVDKLGLKGSNALLHFAAEYFSR